MRTLIRTAAILCLVGLASVHVRAQLPDSPTGRRGNAILAVLRGGPEAATTAFFEDNFTDEYLATETADERREWLAATLERLGDLEVLGVEKTAEFAATILAGSDSAGERVEIAYEVEEAPPHLIAAFDVVSAGETVEPMPQAKLAEAADLYFSALAERDEFAGVVLVAREEEVLFAKPYGLANRRYDAPNRLDTRFNLGSINKIFTKIALAQLARDGKLSFDDTISVHLAGYPDPEVAARVTIAQLASHTAGLGDIFTENFAAAAKSTFRRPADYFPLFAGDPLLFEPGEGQRYSNGGYMVLGAIIEAASGTSYEDHVRRYIFDPAGMTATVAHALDDPQAPIATGYTRQGEGHEHVPLHENSFVIPFTGTPAGGGYSTADDLLRFRHALVGNELLDPRYTAWVIGDELPDEAPDAPRGYGIGIAGGAPGVSAALEIEGDWTIVVLANADPPAATDAARHLRDLAAAVRRFEK